jgi:hypothetical protein
VDNAEVSAVLKSSNLNDVDIDVVFDEPVPAAARLLQGDASTTDPAAPTTPPASDSKTDSGSNSPKDPPSSSKPTDPPSNKKTSNGKKRSIRPINPRSRKLKSKKPRVKNITEESFNATVKCTGPHHRKTCSFQVINSTSSPYKVNFRNSTNNTRGNRPRISGRHTVAYRYKRTTTTTAKTSNQVQPQAGTKPSINTKSNLNS